jgi:hypothetical protein|tara:strand:+ start:363 stop:527 length:165 start_codon:yes stop_codon:yes gene_type:complete
MSEELEGAEPKIDMPNVQGDMGALNQWMSNSDNNSDKEPSSMNDAEFIRDFTKL